MEDSTSSSSSRNGADKQPEKQHQQQQGQQSHVSTFRNIINPSTSNNNNSKITNSSSSSAVDDTTVPSKSRRWNRIAASRSSSAPTMIVTHTSTDHSGALRSSSFVTTVSGEHDSSSTFESSEFLKMSVCNTDMSDNMGNNGMYTGTLMLKTEKPHGKGTMVYTDLNMVYSGQWVQGDWSGFGRLTDTSSRMEYEGGFLDNRKHGLGVIKYPDGRVYDASFQLGKMSHKGHLTWLDGCKYWGYWNDDGIPHGRGKKVFADGSTYDGEFEIGVVQGHGRMTFPDGSWHLGEWQDGVANGLGMRVQSDGRLIHEGMYCHGNSLTISSLPPSVHIEKSSGDFLLYRSSVTNGRTLEGPIPGDVTMRKVQFKC